MNSFSFGFALHKHPHLWLWDPTQRFSKTNSLVCVSKTTLKGLNHQQLLIFVASSSYLLILIVWEWFLVVTLEEEGTIPFRSHKSTFKVSQICENVVRVFFLYLVVLDWNPKCFHGLGPNLNYVEKSCLRFSIGRVWFSIVELFRNWVLLFVGWMFLYSNL